MAKGCIPYLLSTRTEPNPGKEKKRKGGRKGTFPTRRKGGRSTISFFTEGEEGESGGVGRRRGRGGFLFLSQGVKKLPLEEADITGGGGEDF